MLCNWWWLVVDCSCHICVNLVVQFIVCACNLVRAHACPVYIHLFFFLILVICIEFMNIIRFYQVHFALFICRFSLCLNQLDGRSNGILIILHVIVF